MIIVLLSAKTLASTFYFDTDPDPDPDPGHE